MSDGEVRQQPEPGHAEWDAHPSCTGAAPVTSASQHPELQHSPDAQQAASHAQGPPASQAQPDTKQTQAEH